ncbi:hypothetical protein A5724_25645 [Mycobacterium sp. ACS1612]|nr:hypothetical protein A5724_25645 [Mycobacterium sp. ACS1612]
MDTIRTTTGLNMTRTADRHDGRLIPNGWKDGMSHGLDRSAHTADAFAKTSDVNDNAAATVTAEFIRDRMRLDAVQT